MVNAYSDKCFCGIPVNAAACLIAVLHLVFTCCQAVAFFSLRNGDADDWRIPYELRVAIAANFGPSIGEFYVEWAILGAQFVAALLVLCGHVVRCGKFYWPLIAIDIGVLWQNFCFQLAAAINRRTLTLDQLLYFGLVLLAFYCVSLIYRGKRHVDFVNQQRREFAALRAALKREQPATSAEQQPTAPFENEYYELRY
ncbi:hypothetical protein M3Y99_01711400 [Aphelenchoides fujianensis]|nr:hypothetical protein M3Y99_01711400 [Aphelenchoides fujianensis]